MSWGSKLRATNSRTFAVYFLLWLVKLWFFSLFLSWADFRTLVELAASLFACIVCAIVKRMKQEAKRARLEIADRLKSACEFRLALEFSSFQSLHRLTNEASFDLLFLYCNCLLFVWLANSVSSSLFVCFPHFLRCKLQCEYRVCSAVLRVWNFAGKLRQLKSRNNRRKAGSKVKS